MRGCRNNTQDSEKQKISWRCYAAENLCGRFVPVDRLQTRGEYTKYLIAERREVIVEWLAPLASADKDVCTNCNHFTAD